MGKRRREAAAAAAAPAADGLQQIRMRLCIDFSPRQLHDLAQALRDELNARLMRHAPCLNPQLSASSRNPACGQGPGWACKCMLILQILMNPASFSELQHFVVWRLSDPPRVAAHRYDERINGVLLAYWGEAVVKENGRALARTAPRRPDSLRAASPPGGGASRLRG